MKKLAIGFLAGLMIGTPTVSHAATGEWKIWKGLQTGEVIVCKKERGVLAIEKDIHRKGKKTIAVAHCNTKNLGRR